ncbi:MAG: branched-chain amino acid transport system permease protein [Solirubrobacterales bacterium]|jgi:branched-chain amino acid transport system permease protein|nr:branched-chain amino acid transport system permease protein [Solirubrobacterales bacterium]
MTELGQNLIDALALGSLYALIALGITLVYTVMGMMNFAHGEFIMLAAYALYAFAGLPFAAAVTSALLTGIAIALLAERVAFRPVRNTDLSAQLVTSLAVAAILQNVVMVAVDARAQSVETPAAISESTSIGSISVPNLEFVTLGLTGIVLASLGWLLYRTRTGLAMRAAAENFDMARLLGVRADRVIAIAFAISGALAAAVGVLIVMQTGQVSPTMGLTPVLVGFVAVVIGGFGRIFGAAIGGLLLGALSSLLGAYLPEGLVPFRDAIVFTFPVLILIFRPHGLLGGAVGKARV